VGSQELSRRMHGWVTRGERRGVLRAGFGSGISTAFSVRPRVRRAGPKSCPMRRPIKRFTWARCLSL